MARRSGPRRSSRRLEKVQPDYRRDERLLLQARVRDALGETTRALATKASEKERLAA
jgi:hypothetical protein